MKKKFKFLGIIALLSAAIFTVQSCAKDYSGDIDALKSQIAAAQASITSLQNAINAGKLVKTVTQVTNGYTITFSDNTSITITNGATGATGPAGPAGTAGTNGFTPIIGIDADGYWTVVASQGASPVRVKDANGNDVYAKATASNLTLGDDCYLYIDGVKTNAFVPNIAYNATTRKLTVWIQDPTTGVKTAYEVALADDVVLYSDIMALVPPVTTPTAIVSVGDLSTAEAGVIVSGTTTVAQWAGISANTSLTGGKLPVIVNPALATTQGYTFDIIDANGNKYFSGTLSAGWTGTFTQFTLSTGATTGLYTLALTPTPTQIADFGGAGVTKTNLAISATKGTRVIVSPFQYSLQTALATVYDLAGVNVVNTVKIAAGHEDDALTLFNSTWDASKFYKVEVTMDASGTSDNLESLVSINGAKVKLTANNVEGVVKYNIRALDFTGKYSIGSVVQPYFTALTISSAVSIPVSYTIASANTQLVNLQPFFDRLSADGKLSAWRANAGTLAISGLPAGVTTTFERIDPVTSLPTAVGVDATNVQYVLFTFTNTTVVPTTTAAAVTFTYVDSRIPASVPNYTESTVALPLTISNPDLTAKIAAVIASHKSAYFTSPTMAGVWAAVAGSFDLTQAYNNITTALGTTAGVANTALFAIYPTTGNGEGTITVSPTFNYTKPDTTTVRLSMAVCGNTSNLVTIEDVSIAVKSSVLPFTILPTTYGTTPTNVELYVNHAATAVTTTAHPAQLLSNYIKFQDPLGAALTAWGTYTYDGASAITTQTVDLRLPVPTATTRPIVVEATGQYANLVVLTPQGTFPGTSSTQSTDYAFAATYTTTVGAPILFSDVVVPLKVTITDRFGISNVQYVNLTVKKP